jgi:hypothetical protein
MWTLMTLKEREQIDQYLAELEVDRLLREAARKDKE